MRRRLQDIGLISGTQVSCVLRAPAGDPTAYAIRGAVIALRREDAAHVLISGV
jgi:ferrous iron transport protein A